MSDQLLRAASRRLERVPVDVGLAVGVGLFQVACILSIGHFQEGREPIDALAVALLMAGPVALVWRRRYPLTVLALNLVTTLSYWALDYPRGPVFVALLIAFATVMVEGHRVAAWVSLVVAGAGFLWLPALVGDTDMPPIGKAIGLAAWLLVVGALMEVIVHHKEAKHEAERARHQEEATRAEQERLRIARELHDVLAHNVSLINVQAGTALHLLDKQPELARPALEAIKEASSETLREVRSVLDVLRRPGEDAPLSPAAGLVSLEDLIARTAAAGIAVESDVRGEPRPLPASVDLAVYRILQEALTNVARHAQPSNAVVRLTYGEDDVTLEVEDDGVPRANGGAGNGIAGMRERVAALGGDFSAGPRDGSGFRVAARLPL